MNYKREEGRYPAPTSLTTPSGSAFNKAANHASRDAHPDSGYGYSQGIYSADLAPVPPGEVAVRRLVVCAHGSARFPIGLLSP